MQYYKYYYLELGFYREYTKTNITEVFRRIAKLDNGHLIIAPSFLNCQGETLSSRVLLTI